MVQRRYFAFVGVIPDDVLRNVQIGSAFTYALYAFETAFETQMKCRILRLCQGLHRLLKTKSIFRERNTLFFGTFYL